MEELLKLYFGFMFGVILSTVLTTSQIIIYSSIFILMITVVILLSKLNNMFNKIQK